MRVNRRQKIVICAGLAVALLMGLVPPSSVSYAGGGSRTTWIEYRPLFFPGGRGGIGVTFKLDAVRLVLQLCLVAGATAGIVWLLGGSKPGSKPLDGRDERAVRDNKGTVQNPRKP